MIVLSVYITLLAMLILSLSPLFSPVFELMQVPTGSKTVVIQAVSLVVAASIYLMRTKHKRLSSELMAVVLVWAPFLLLSMIRTDFSDHHAVVKLGKLFFINFLSVVTITAVYLSGINRFNRYFCSVLVFVILLQLIEALVNPAIFLYASSLERITIEGVNPIWLARSFVTAALCCLVLPIKSNLVKISGVVVFMLAVVPTGSRGPLLAGVAGIAIYLWAHNRHKANFNIKAICAGVALLLLFLVSPQPVSDGAREYIFRDSGKGIFQESGRDTLFTRAIDDYISAPLIGVGFGQYARSQHSKTHIISLNKEGYYPHNIILEVMAELGTIGLLLLVILLRTGRYCFKITNIYQVLFIIYFLFAMTSGNIVANAGLMVFGALARLSYLYPQQTNQAG